MTYVETPMTVGEAPTGRTPGLPTDPTGVGTEWVDPAGIRPVLADGIESAELTSARGTAYVMLRSPDDGERPYYLRLTPDEWELAQLMDGTHTVARLVAEFARIAGRLSPEEVRRVVADLAGHRMLDEPSTPTTLRPGGLTGALRGRRMGAVRVDGLFSALYRAGGRFLFTRAAEAVAALVALLGLGLFVLTWARGDQSVFVAGGSYLLGAVVLLALGTVALGVHEFGHGLATKHAGRAVHAAGLYVRFGVPSVYVDTSDVWMAGRRARMRTTAAGPAAALTLAGLAQLVGLAVPPLAGVAFTLAFVSYLQVLLTLSPFLPLDGYRLLMEWLEIPDLRARALSWLSGRLRRRSRSFGSMDGEGRLIALYGALALLWLVMAVNVAYRIWVDRVAGLVTGLWPGGPAGRLLLAAVLLGLCAPVLYLLVSRTVAELRRYRRRLVERRREADAPRRLAALRASELGGLDEPALASLAARARWLHPATGRQLVTAGGSPSAVYVVVDGALQAREPGDPGGTIRHHVGPGGVVGLADALTGRTSALDWHTAGTTLLALSTAAVATVIGPLPGPPADDRAEAEALFADTPALACLAEDERLALIGSAHPLDLEPGDPVNLPGPTYAVVVESGVIALPDGVELRRGTLVGPVGVGDPGMVAQARTPVRLWVLPDAASLPPLVGSAQRAAEARVGLAVPTARQAPAAGGHPRAGYPPLAVSPGPPDGVDPAPDHRFERGMWWLSGLSLAGALLLTGSAVFAGPAWAEMPTDRALLVADGADVTITVDGLAARLGAGDERYVSDSARVEVGAGSTGRVTFRGGGAVVLCAGAAGTVSGLSVAGDRPSGTVTVFNGRLLVDTAATSGAYAPLALVVRRADGDVRNVGPARYAVDGPAVAVAAGRVLVADVPVAPAGAVADCAGAVREAPPAGSGDPSDEAPSETPTVAPADVLPTVSDSPSATPEPTVTPTDDADTGPDDSDPEPENTTVRPRPVTPTARPTTTRPSPRPTRTTTRPSPKPTTPRPTTPRPTTPPPTVDPPPPTTAPPVAGGNIKPGASSGGTVVVTVSRTPRVDG